VKGKTILEFDSTHPSSIAGRGVVAVILAKKPDDLLARYNSIPYIFTDYEIGTHILQYIRTTRSLYLDAKTLCYISPFTFLKYIHY